jgi:hypothetical protein
MMKTMKTLNTLVALGLLLSVSAISAPSVRAESREQAANSSSRTNSQMGTVKSIIGPLIIVHLENGQTVHINSSPAQLGIWNLIEGMTVLVEGNRIVDIGYTPLAPLSQS